MVSIAMRRSGFFGAQFLSNCRVQIFVFEGSDCCLPPPDLPLWCSLTLRIGSPVLRQCLSYRGVIPIMPTADLAGSIELLAYAIGYAKANGLVEVGDRIVVSQCPRKDTSDVMEEVGVVSLVQVV